MSRHARRYTLYQHSTEATGLDMKHLGRHTVTRARWIRVGARAFPLAEAEQYYGPMIANNPEHTLALRPVPKES